MNPFFERVVYFRSCRTWKKTIPNVPKRSQSKNEIIINIKWTELKMFVVNSI